MICFDSHPKWPMSAGFGWGPWGQPPEGGPAEDLTFNEWLLHRLFVHAPEWLRETLARIGFIDTIPYLRCHCESRLVKDLHRGNCHKEWIHDGGVAFWRWTFWRSGFAREWRAMDRAMRRRE